MYYRPALGLAQVRAAMSAMLEEAAKRPELPVAIAIVDESGDLLSYARMDNCREVPQRLAIKKAYTCAMMGQDSQALLSRLKSQHRSLADLGDPHMAGSPGGVVIRRPSDGAILGAIGVSGLFGAAEDEALSRVGLEALNLDQD